jgi:hypothetical protein
MMHVCTCRNCKHVMVKKRPNPFCGPACRHEYNKQHKPSAILSGALNDPSNTRNKQD